MLRRLGFHQLTSTPDAWPRLWISSRYSDPDPPQPWNNTGIRADVQPD